MAFTWNHILYRLYDAADTLLYVGRTNDVRSRFKAHARRQPWWPEVARSALELRPDLDALIEAERAAILTEHPKYNIIYNGRIIPEQYEQGWREPWLTASDRLTAGADHLHEECRRHYAGSYPGEESQGSDPPCLHCVRRAADFLIAVDNALAHVDEAIVAARDAAIHALWLKSAETTRPRPDWLRTLPCKCRECIPLASRPA